MTAERLTPRAILGEAGIAFVARPAYTTSCPNCGKGSGYLNVKIGKDSCAWFCHSCGKGGGKYYVSSKDRKPRFDDLGEPVAVYVYRNEQRLPLFEVVRFEPAGLPKRFLQRKDKLQQTWGIKGIRRVLYQLPHVVEAIAAGQTLYLVEGEKDVETLEGHGLPATCNPGGACIGRDIGRWLPGYSESLRGGDVVLIGDHDAPGAEHVRNVGRRLHGIAARVRVLDWLRLWPEIEVSDDVSDWFHRGAGNVARLLAAVAELPDWQPAAGNGADHGPALGVLDADTGMFEPYAADHDYQPPGEPPAKLRPGPRDDLTVAAWLSRELPPRDYLLANLMCTTSRWLAYGSTGIGKTLFFMSMGAAIAGGHDFLGWSGRRKTRVMYIDGELPAETFKERIELIAKTFGPDIPFYGYNREVIPEGEMPPLNTDDGQKWLLHEISIVKPDLIFLDSIMCLLVGTMSEEESWAPVKTMVRQLSALHVAQVWLHHTGHDASRGFGTKTREWEMDTVVRLSKADEEDQSSPVKLEFTKARLRTPETAKQFETRLVQPTPGAGDWQVAGEAGRSGPIKITEFVRRSFLAAYNRLADGVPKQPGFDGAPVAKVRVDAIRDEMKDRGTLERAGDNVSATGRSQFHRAKAELIATGVVVEGAGFVWQIRH